MSELNFKGKEFVFNHHLTVSFRPLIPAPDKSIGEPRLDGNLIIYGDNLLALKSLLPMYAGKIDCIYIDPPYNTGNEGWRYNDNVNSPIMQQWLKENPVGIEDGLRHDKWLSMMWPRLRLLRELLADHGVIFVSIDDHESHRLQLVLDEIFGEYNGLGRIIVRLNPKGRHLDKFFAKTHEYVLVYAKNHENIQIGGLRKSGDMLNEYSEEDNDGKYRLIELRNRNSTFNKETRPNLYYPIYVDPKNLTISLKRTGGFTEEALPHDSTDLPTCWTWSREKVESNSKLLVPKKTDTGKWRIFRKDHLVREDGEEATTKPKTIWLDADLNMDLARKTVSNILGKNAFDFPKPVGLVQRLVELVDIDDAIILDSFAGSGTTGHAVLNANAKDGGNRKFILVECEEYADQLTAERIRKVISGYAFQGSIREELFKRSITFRDLKNSQDLMEKVLGIERSELPRFDRIRKKIEDGELLVEGVKNVAEKIDGLGGNFTYCTLGEAVDMDKMLTGKALPVFEQLGAILFLTATNEPINPAKVSMGDDGLGYLGESSAFHVWLIYKPESGFLKSRESALTLTKARDIASRKPKKRHLVFASAKFVSQKILEDEKIPVEFAPLPWALYRIGGGPDGNP